LAAATGSLAVAVNPVTNKTYVSGNNMTVITEQQVQAIPLQAAITPLPNNVTASPSPTFTFTASSNFAPTAPPADALYFQFDTWQGGWTPANPASTPGSFSATAPTLALGTHILYAYATDGQDATSIMGGLGSSPVIGSISAYLFTVQPAPTSTTLSADVNPVFAGGSVTFTATVTTVPASSTVPTGSVTFNDGTTALGTVTLDNTGHASLKTSSLTTGAHLITAVYAPSAAFARSTSAALTENVEDFSLVAASGANCPSGGNCSTSATITAGQTATYNLQVSPAGGFNGTVMLTCMGAPGGSTCSASPASVPPSGSSSYAFTITVSNTAYVVVPPWPQFRGRPILPGLRIALPLFLAVLMVLLWRKAVAEKRPARALLPALTVFLFSVMFFYGCGGGYGGGGGGTKPPTNATLTITGSSGGVNRTLTLSLTINH